LLAHGDPITSGTQNRFARTNPPLAGVHRVTQADAEVQIVVVAPQSSAGAVSDSVRALEQLGPRAVIAVSHDAATCLAHCRKSEIDLVVVHEGLGDERAEILDALRDVGPPVIAVNEQGSESVALEAFVRGAADCITISPEFSDVLPVVALEQIHRWRRMTERGVAERRIRDLESYNENIIQNLNSALLVVDNSGAITTCNPLAEQVLGESEAALLGRSLWDWFVAIDRNDIHVARTLSDGERFKGSESVITRSDGTEVPIGISCAPIIDTSGNQLGAVAVFSDLTEIKQLQRQFLQTEKMASIGQLAAGVAHEINNPMGFIHANLFQMAEYLTDLRKVWEEVDALVQTVERGNLDEIRKSADRLTAHGVEVDVDFVLNDFAKAIRESQEGSERIRHIVHDLRDFSHHDIENRVLSDVNQCLDSTANIVWPMMKHLVVLDRQYQDLPEISCFPMQLKQVFMNLLVNAYQAIEERLGEGPETGNVWLKTEYRDGCVVVSVTDTGSGIAPENLDRIFDPFFTTKQVGAGTGLGLSTCFNIVERHAGTIRVESTPGEQTTFIVTLPDRTSPASAQRGSGA
jgi:PAS domain S-box-containing protein